jgi:uncharacterized protein
VEHVIQLIGIQIRKNMSESNTTLYTIPIDDKYIIYSPLLPLAFIGNKAMVNIVNQKIKNPGVKVYKNELIDAIEKTGLFMPDKKQVPACDCSQPFKPTLCILMPTTACNLACTYCYAAYEGKKQVHLSWPVAKKAIDIAFQNSINPKNGKFSLSFHGGGEPTLPSDFFFKAAGYARKLDPQCPVSVTTNAVWDKVFRDKALEILSEISISFDGNEITQNRQRPDKQGNATFSRVIETIREIENRKIPYGIRMTVTRESLPELPSNIEFLCAHTECRSFQVEAVYNQGRAEGSGLTIDDINAFVDIYMDVYRYAMKRGKNLYYSAARPHLITSSFCAATSNALIVTADGELTACYEVFDNSHVLADDFIIGKIDLHDGIILYPGKRANLLAKINENRSSCKDCFCYYHCAGDCPPKAFLAHLTNDQFRCSVTRAITRELIIDRIAEYDGFWQGDVSGKQPVTAQRCGTPNKL